MSEFEDKLNSILSSPDAMGQIMAIANSLNGGQSAQSSGASAPQDGTDSPQSQVGETPSATASMPDLSALLSALGGNSGSGENASSAGLGSIDPAMMANLIALFSEYNRNDDQKTALLLALRPFLKEERWEKVDKAVQIARTSRVIRLALQMFKGGEQDV